MLFVFWLRYIPPPGYAIGALAVVAGIMSVRDMKTLGKISWIALLVCLLITEFRAIDKDRADNARAQRDFFDTQKAGFDGVATQASKNFSATAGGLTTAIQTLDSTLRVGQQAADLAGKGATTSGLIAQQNEEAQEREDRALCSETANLRADVGVRINGMAGYARMMGKAQQSKNEAQKQNLQEEFDAYFRDSLQPELRSLTYRLMARLKKSGPLPNGFLSKTLWRDTEFSPSDIQGALNELDQTKQQVCPVHKQP